MLHSFHHLNFPVLPLGIPPSFVTEDTIPFPYDDPMNAAAVYMKNCSSKQLNNFYSLLQCFHLLPIVREFFDCRIRLWIANHVKQYLRRSRDIMRTGKQSTYCLGGRLYTGGKDTRGETLPLQQFHPFPAPVTSIHTFQL